jgi:hypothetical protein
MRSSNYLDLSNFPLKIGEAWLHTIPDSTWSTSFEGQELYDSVQTHFSDAVGKEFLYVSNPVSEYGVP